MKKKKSKWMVEIKKRDFELRSSAFGPGKTQLDVLKFIEKNGSTYINDAVDIKKFRRSFLWWRRLCNINFAGNIVYVDYGSNRMKELAGIK